MSHTGMSVLLSRIPLQLDRRVTKQMLRSEAVEMRKRRFDSELRISTIVSEFVSEIIDTVVVDLVSPIALVDDQWPLA